MVSDEKIENKDNSYKSILKRISAFGGVQVFNILINLVRGKFVALILGPAGMGVSSLFTTASTTIQQLAGLGLNLSVVKEVAASEKDSAGRSLILHIARRLILLTSLLGAAVCIVLSPWLSRLTFGNYDYTIGFVLLGAAVALSIAGAGYLAILQGMGEIKRLSKASIVGSLTGLLFGVPLYYFFGTSGIVPAMIILSFAVAAFYLYSFRKSVKLTPIEDFKFSSHTRLIRRLISLGIVFMIGSLVGSAVNYLINTFIRWQGSLADVGLFQGANSLTNQYMGIVFSALAMDYFPRLSAIASDTPKLRHIVNRQSEIVMLIATPIVILVMVLAPLAIRILLSSEFLAVAPLIRWLALGVLLQGISFPLGYLFLAKDNKKVYIWLEVVSGNIIWFATSAGGYLLFGLIGLGIALAVRTVIDIFLNYLICRRYYQFEYTSRTVFTVGICALAGVVALILSLNDAFLPAYIALWILTASATLICLLRLRFLLQSEKNSRSASDSPSSDD